MPFFQRIRRIFTGSLGGTRPRWRRFPRPPRRLSRRDSKSGAGHDGPLRRNKIHTCFPVKFAIDYFRGRDYNGIWVQHFCCRVGRRVKCLVLHEAAGSCRSPGLPIYLCCLLG